MSSVKSDNGHQIMTFHVYRWPHKEWQNEGFITLIIASRMAYHKPRCRNIKRENHMALILKLKYYRTSSTTKAPVMRQHYAIRLLS